MSDRNVCKEAQLNIRHRNVFLEKENGFGGVLAPIIWDPFSPPHLRDEVRFGHQSCPRHTPVLVCQVSCVKKRGSSVLESLISVTCVGNSFKLYAEIRSTFGDERNLFKITIKKT